ncbi:TonB-dependent receptor [Paludibaculum fermentans]|uniref:Carboxypeptidase regulatory-like domain-containing protein n=1 Tax=Paludibaculum fermentans TaxID=1473598 RepID=A0A7S7SKA6_PALFE|nr:TonB-dependent receptor [Paludibaculum fermentans]QOY87276.1 carboxypeptidase regulatory-like domain-containing protein [Paludibaculum fermentans]
MNNNYARGVFTAFLLAMVFALVAAAQSTTVVKGEVDDPSGSFVPGAQVTLSGGKGYTKTVTTNELGTYEFEPLPPGKYKLRVAATGFTPLEVRNLNLEGGKPITLKSQLAIASETQSVTVADYTSVSVETSSVAGAIVLRGEDLDVLSDDPDDLASDLQALAGPSAGPNGGDIYVDGFSGGKLPPKSSIREVRVNQNPFSAEYDRLGFGRIEILTKPGTDKLRGQAFFNFGNENLNSRNPFATTRAPYNMRHYGFNLGGPLSKKASWFIDVDRREIDENAVISATVLDSNFLATPFQQTVVTPLRHWSINPRIDYQLSQNNTLVVRYSEARNNNQNQGLGQFTLPSRATSSESSDHILQMTETAILGTHAVNETRFQYNRSNSLMMGDNSTPALNVLESFNSGGSLIKDSGSRENRFEWQNITSITHGTHMIKLGGRVRYDRIGDTSDSNFNGSYTFAGGLAPLLDSSNNIVNGADGSPTMVQVTSLERYRRTLYFQSLGLPAATIRALGGGASQFTLTGGTPLTNVAQTDIGLFAEDTWRLRPNLNLSYGLRYETQSNISDYKDLAPRISIAYGLGKTPAQTKTVVRTGFGMFYDRVGDNLTLQSLRFNGTTQQQYIVANPDFYPAIPDTATLASNLVDPTRRTLVNDIRAPYIAQTIFGVDRQLPKNTSVSTNFIYSRGVHMLRTRNVNAPLADGTFPMGNIGNVYQYESTGFLTQKQLMINVSSRFNRYFTLFGFYVLGQAKSDTDGVGSFPVNQYNLTSEYGNAAYDVRHRMMLGGSIRAKWGISFNPFIMASSGSPFNITTGRDNNGDTLFNDRPSFAAAGATGANIVSTAFGVFNLTPGQNDVLIPRNYGRGPAQFTVNLRASRTWGFGERTSGTTTQAGGDGPMRGGMGPMGGGGGGMRGGGGGGMRGGGPGGPGGMFDSSSGKRFSLTASASARNLLNHVNYGSPIGNLSSPLFGESNSIGGGFGPGGMGGGGGAGNRRIDLQLRLSF